MFQGCLLKLIKMKSKVNQTHSVLCDYFIVSVTFEDIRVYYVHTGYYYKQVKQHSGMDAI